MVLEQERGQIVEYCRRLPSDGLVVATSGNISARSGDMVAVTPSGVDYEQLTADLVGVYRLDGAPVEARLAPTTELPMHLAVYRQTRAQAIVHTHSTAATAVSTLLDELPPSVDPCGERGEFHTCAVAGPMFTKRINVEPGIVVERDGFVFADLTLQIRPAPAVGSGRAGTPRS